MPSRSPHPSQLQHRLVPDRPAVEPRGPRAPASATVSPRGTQPQPAEQDLEPGRALVVGDQPVGQPQRARVGRTGPADPDVRPAGPAQVLDQRQQSRLEHLQRPVMTPRTARGCRAAAEPGVAVDVEELCSHRPRSRQPPGVAAG